MSNTKTRNTKTLVVTDLDGTFWDTSLQAHPATLEASAEIVDDPATSLLVATGRRRNSAHRGLVANRIEAPAVLLNGAVGWDFATSTRFHSAPFEPHDLCAVLDALYEAGVVPLAYSADTRAIATEGITTSVGHLESLGSDLVWMTTEELRHEREILLMGVLGVEASHVEVISEELAQGLHAETAAYADELHPPFSLMVAPPGITKETGIRAWLEYAACEPDRIVALGDGGNDLEMLAMADVALVVDGGDSRALALADHVIAHPSVGGWAAVLDHI